MNLENSVWKMLDDLNKKSGITEIIINNIDNVYIEREGELVRLNIKHASEHISQFIKDVASFNKSELNSRYPLLDGSLPDGSRINIVSSEFTGAAPAITIRKYLKTIKNFDGSPGIFGLDERAIQFLKTLVIAKKNIIVSGGTGSGKTTFLNLLLQEVPSIERVITIEDTRELQFKLPNSVRLLAKQSTTESLKSLSIRDLLKNTLRMRPDRIIIGEVRGEEAFDLLQAMNTGHDGSMCTIHANNPPEALSRLENLFMFAGFDIPVKAIRQQICGAIDYVVQLDRNREGKRIVSKISEINNMEQDRILFSDIMNSTGGMPSFTGLVPSQMKSLMEFGLTADFFL